MSAETADAGLGMQKTFDPICFDFVGKARLTRSTYDKQI